jgi:hypothetical protein
MTRRPVIAVRFTLPSGNVLERDWTLDELQDDGDQAFELMLRSGPPAWLEEPKREWEKPQDPILFTGQVRPGREAEAIKAVMG